MPLPNLSVPQFPSVPKLPGVPPIPRNALASAVTIAAPIISDVLNLFAPIWGVFGPSGDQVLLPDTFLGISYRNSRHIANYPIEQGAFASYNKVQDPFDADVRVAVGGTVEDREQFLAALEALANSLDLYTLVTPDATYPNVNLARFDYRREIDGGAGLIVANCHFVEIRQAAAMQVVGAPNPTQVQAPSSAAVVSQGHVMPQTPSVSISSSIAYGGATGTW